MSPYLGSGREALAPTHLSIGDGATSGSRPTTTGRKSGRTRHAHLIAVPFRETLAVLGTNFGQPSTPARVLNLEADSRAAVTHQGITRDVLARGATADEGVQILSGSASFYGGYTKYQQRIAGRRLRIFVLEPAV